MKLKPTAALGLLVMCIQLAEMHAEDVPISILLRAQPESNWKDPHTPVIEETVTNTLKTGVCIGCTQLSRIVVTKSDGSSAPQTSEGKRYIESMSRPNHNSTTACVSNQLDPGQAVTYTTEDVGRFYDMRQPGVYTVYVESEDPGVYVARSNRISIRIK